MILHTIFYIIRIGQKRSSNLLSDHFVDKATNKSADLSPWSYTAISWRKKAYILGDLVFPLYLYKTCSTSEISAFLLTLSHPLSNSQESLVYQDTLSTTDTSSFYKSLRTDRKSSETKWGPYKIRKGFLFCFVLKLQGVCLNIQSYLTLSSTVSSAA